MYQVVKRDGKVDEFDITKISAAITKAFVAQNKNYHPGVIDFLALKVTSNFENKIKDGKVTVEDVAAYLDAEQRNVIKEICYDELLYDYLYENNQIMMGEVPMN